METKKFLKVWNDLDRYPTLDAVAAEMRCHRRTAQMEAKKLSLEGHKLIDRRKAYEESASKIKTFDQDKKIYELNSQISILKDKLNKAHEEVLNSEKMKHIIYGIKDAPDYDTGWLTFRPKNATNTTGIPALMISDVHFDEVVTPSQVGMVNEYNREIAIRRLKRTFEITVELTKKRMINPKYDGIVVCLAGDIISGNIHEELECSNDSTILNSVLTVSDILSSGIGMLADEFKKVHVVCVVGNHGRIHKKPRAKNRVQDNFEWLIYHTIAKQFINDGRVSFTIPESTDANFKIYDTSFLLTHGDQFFGGSGISGIFTPIMLGTARKKQRQQAIRTPFDVLLCGHFHQYIHTNQVVTNGSIKGYDEYAYVCNFPFEVPQQALWINHQEHGITFRMPILCEDKNGNAKSSKRR